MAAPRIPVSDTYPVELHFLKALFLEGQYRRCIQACRDIIKMAVANLDDKPLHKTFVHFYRALAHDAMARAMHHNSISKLPALTAAEQAYLEALNSLPPPDECRYWCAQRAERAESDPFLDHEPMSPSMQSPTFTERCSFELSSPTSFSSPWSPITSSIKSPPAAPSCMNLAAELDGDLESEDGFSELAAPKRAPRELPRDISRISLLDETSKIPLPRDISRMSLLELTPTPPQCPKDTPHGSRSSSLSIQQKQTTSKLPCHKSVSQIRSKSPQFANRAKTEPRMAGAKFSFPQQYVSPMSSSNYTRRWSNASTVSAVSPDFTVQHGSYIPSSTSLPNRDSFDSDRASQFIFQIDTLREQLSHHIASIQHAKFQAQEKKKPPGMAPTMVTPINKSPTDSGPVQQARSFWSFVPENVKKVERQTRIEAGKARNWQRKRFDPTRYRDLCDTALAEL